MLRLTGREIRRAFLDFFRERGHTVVPSSSLVPAGDPTLLFTNAGMVQFKDVFTGERRVPYARAATVQKCVRAGGKHNDLDNVGRTARHHTFFEMLGNFSFGDYFKEAAIEYAWEFLVGILGLPADRLWATVYRDDDEAASLWRRKAGLPPERIVRLGEKDNFWSMGDTGPCGPCSEVVMDRGEEFRCGAPLCALDACGCDRWLELWNLVFMQYERRPDGTMVPLPRPSIDTGMGLERIASVLQGVASNFETDLFTPYLRFVEELTGRRYEPGPAGFPLRVIADHGRAVVFLVADGVVPSNEGRGFVLRRILRRAARFGRVLGLEEPFLHSLAPVVAEVMGEAYPELRAGLDVVRQVVRGEEERFLATLEQGTRLFRYVAERVRGEGGTRIAGEEAFLLYDTYGLPLDILQDLAEEEGLAVDREGFERALEAQRQRARADREQRMEVLAGEREAAASLPASNFAGYDRLALRARVTALLGGESARGVASQGAGEESRAVVLRLGAGSEGGVVLDVTPFYPEGGGQVGDAGVLRWEGGAFQVRDTRRLGAAVVHFGTVTAGELAVGQEVEALVDDDRRRATARNHSATHLLHRALKVVLGPHVRQAGSLVAPDRLRFDFTHSRPLTPAELRRLEELVNDRVLAGIPVQTEETDLREALAAGAEALFGEKYGERVRMVTMGDFSRELCGGTHVANTAEVGLFKVISQESVAAGVRRLEAVTARAALRHVWDSEEELDQAAEALRSPRREVAERVASLVEELRARERRLAQLERELLRHQSEGLLRSAQEVEGVRVVAGEAPVASMEALRELGDRLRERLGSGVVLLAARQDGKVVFLAMVTGDLVARGLHAGRIVNEAARVAGGGGGGRPDMAQAGGRDPSRLAEALAAGIEAVRRARSAPA